MLQLIVLSLLWLKPNGIIYESLLGQRLRENRDLFVTRQAYHSFSGYAHDQFKKMISFNQEAQALWKISFFKHGSVDLSANLLVDYPRTKWQGSSGS